MKRYSIIAYAMVLVVQLFAHEQSWTSLLQITFDEEFLETYKERRELTFIKSEVQPFSQLIFSWNAYRPARGYFRFWAQVRDATTKQWYQWHRMMDWGFGVQRSYADITGKGTDYHHVRLEVARHTLADAVRIKVSAHDGADMSYLVGIFINIANMHAFKPESVEMIAHLPSVYIQKVPKISQMEIEHHKKEVICSPTSCSMLVGHLTHRAVDASLFAESSFDHGLQAYGSWPFNVAHAFEHTSAHAHIKVVRLHSFVDLHARLREGIPVVVSVRGPMKGSASEYASGHLLVVVGWDARKKQVLCHDPAFDKHQKTAVAYDAQTFLEGWERSRRLAYIADTVPQPS